MSGSCRTGLLVALGVALTACGPTPPQAPFADAQKLDSSTSAISTACGLAYQASAFPGNHRADFITLEVTASSAARKLAGVYKHNPDWIYQGETIRQITGQSVSMLGACGLKRAAVTLTRATTG
jgi:hypothetical protein